MMQCHIKDKRLHVPEYIIPMHSAQSGGLVCKKKLKVYIKVSIFII